MISFLFVDSERVWRGGQDQLFSLLRGLIGRGHRIGLICHPGTLLEARCRAEGIHVYPLAARLWMSPLTYFRLVAILRHFRPQVLACNTPKPVFVCSCASRWIPKMARIIFRRVNFPLRRNLMTRVKYNWGIDCVVAISESISRQLEHGSIPASRIRIIYEGIDPAAFPCHEPREPYPPGYKCTIGTVAHLSAEKGQSYLVEAASHIRDVRRRMKFVIVGDGEQKAELEAMVRRLGLDDCFEFAGFQLTTLPYLARFDIFVLPSLSEGLSSAILAAMATGLPVVATDVGGIPELVKPDENGLLVPAGDSLALARAIEYLVENPELAARMGRRGRERIEQQFTLDRKIAETERLCSELVGRKSVGKESRGG